MLIKVNILKSNMIIKNKKKNNLRESQTLIRISRKTFTKIQSLAKELGYAQITTLEYLLDGTINLDKLK